MPHESTPELKTNRFAVQQLHGAENPRYAVFARTASGQAARFNAIHDSEESALKTARFHAAERAGNGSLDFTFYVVEIKHRVGIEHGKLVDMPTA